MNKHPHFGHTMADRNMVHHQSPLSFHGPIVHVNAIIKLVEQNDSNPMGGLHQLFIVNQIEVIDIQGAAPSLVKDEAFCAIRYGDNLGLQQPIPGLEAGQKIEIKGEYIDQNHALPGVGNPGDAVIHFTHHPVGFVNYQGKHYE